MSEILDLKDKKIIYNLDFDARMPISKLAKMIGLSKQVTKYRLDQLQKRNIIQGFYTDINPSKIGYDIYLVYLSFQKLHPKKEKEFISHISKQKKVGVNTSLQGKWDHTIGIWAKNIYEFRDTYKEIMNQWDQFVKRKIIMIPTDFFYYKPKQIFEKKEDKQIVMHGKKQIVELDKIDNKILTELSKNARITLIELSKLTGLTANGVKQRIKKLEKENVILGYRIMINYLKLGFLHYRVFLHLENLTEKNENEIIEFLKNNKAIVSTTKTIGYSELEFRALVKDINEFYDLIEQLRTKFPDLIKDYESILYLKFHESLNYFPIEKEFKD